MTNTQKESSKDTTLLPSIEIDDHWYLRPEDMPLWLRGRYCDRYRANMVNYKTHFKAAFVWKEPSQASLRRMYWLIDQYLLGKLKGKIP